MPLPSFLLLDFAARALRLQQLPGTEAAPQQAPPDTVPDLQALFTELGDRLLDPDAWMAGVGTLLQMLLIVGLTLLAIRLIDHVTDRWTQRLSDLPALHPRRQRALTISNLISSTARYVIWPVALIMLLSELAIDVGALIATAGVAGLAVGFGAQTLVKDVISGLFLLFDDTIHVGDRIQVKGEYCTVEQIGVRLIKARKFDGELLMIPAGELRIFGNTSIGFARVIVNVGVSYEQDVETILPVMERVAAAWAEERSEILLEDAPAVQAINSFGESSIDVRIVVQVKPGEQFEAERDLRRQLKQAFDDAGIEIPFPRRTLYMRQEDELPPRRAADPQASPAAEDDTEGSD